MRKSLIICCVITILAMAGVMGFGLIVGAQDEEVYLQENILVGDPAYAEDISFQIRSHWQEKMLWETFADLGEELVTDTEFAFYPDGFDYELPSQSSARFEYSMSFGYSSSGSLLDGDDGRHSEIPFYNVFVDVASRTEPGSTRTEIVKLAEYYQYFDMRLDFNSRKYNRYSYNGILDENENEFSYINKVLGMRIPEELEFEATVEKSENGNVYDIHGNAVENKIRIISDGIVLKDGIYVYVYVINDEGLLPGVSESGYGIYKLPFAWDEPGEEKNETAFILIDDFSLVYPLEEKILAMKADETEEEIFLLIEREGSIFLQRIEKENMVLLQEFALGKSEEWLACHDMQVTEKGVILLMNDRRICFAEKQGEDYFITVNYQMPDEEAFHSGAWDTYAFDYEAGRLAILWGGSKGHYYTCSSSAYVFVLEGEELKFLSHYENSLDHADTFWDYSNKLHPGQPYEIWFEE